MDLLELELMHMVNFPLLWESLVHVSNSDPGIKCYNQRMIILTSFLFKPVAEAFVSLDFYYYFYTTIKLVHFPGVFKSLNPIKTIIFFFFGDNFIINS